jgi:hypothetical protein
VFNRNVAYELGMMHLLGRTCRILKHSSLTALQTDILMKLYLSYANLEEAGQHLTLWLDKPNLGGLRRGAYLFSNSSDFSTTSNAARGRAMRRTLARSDSSRGSSSRSAFTLKPSVARLFALMAAPLSSR